MTQRSFPFLLRQIGFTLCLCLLANSMACEAASPAGADQAKMQFEKHGIGSTVRVNETNGVHVKGRIISIGVDGAVIAPKGSVDVLVPYVEVTSVKGPGLSTGAKVGIIVVVGVAVVGIVAIVLLKKSRIGPINIGPIS
jgi:hypothetical protein